MGSGLILLVIVGAWLAVLVPMGLRSSAGSGTLLPAVPREPLGAGEPGRVLSRRARPVPRPAADPEPEPEAEPAPVRARPGQARRDARRARRDARTPASRRRRRVLALLLLLAVTLVVAALAGPEVLGPVGAGLAGLLLLLVVHLRRAAVKRRVRARAERRDREAALRAERLAEQERLRLEAEELAREQELARRRRHVPGIPSRMPPRPGPPVREEQDEPVPLRAAVGSEWQPRPVPLPMYVRQAPERPAPARAPRPAAPAPAAEPAPYEHRRVSGGW